MNFDLVYNSRNLQTHSHVRSIDERKSLEAIDQFFFPFVVAWFILFII